MAPRNTFPTETDMQQLEQEGFSHDQIAGLLALRALYTQGVYHEDDPERNRQEFIRFHFDFFEILGEKFDADRFRTDDIFPDFRQTQTAFFEYRFSMRAGNNRINKYEWKHMFISFRSGNIDHGHHQRLSHLIRSQTDALGMMHRFLHIANQLLQFLSILSDLRRFFS